LCSQISGKMFFIIFTPFLWPAACYVLNVLLHFLLFSFLVFNIFFFSFCLWFSFELRPWVLLVVQGVWHQRWIYQYSILFSWNFTIWTFYKLFCHFWHFLLKWTIFYLSDGFRRVTHTENTTNSTIRQSTHGAAYTHGTQG
jgi:hypothetical protein